MTLPGDTNRFRQGVPLVTGTLLLLLSGASWLPAQTGLPSTAPTVGAERSVSQLPSAQPQVQRTPGHLAVLWNGAALQVEANNVSLNAVLHEIAARTKMKITGSAPEERIFGTYGPGPLNLVIPALLEGAAVNLLLTEREGGAADELLLTTRTGGATPAYVPTQQDAAENRGAQPGPLPPPSSYGPAVRGATLNGLRYGNNARSNTTDGVVPDNGINGRDNGLNGPSNGLNGADNGVNGRDNGQNGTDNGLNNSSGAANAAASGNSTTDSTTSASPNGVRTPQEIFEQLQRLRQQQSTQTTPQ